MYTSAAPKTRYTVDTDAKMGVLISSIVGDKTMDRVLMSQMKLK